MQLKYLGHSAFLLTTKGTNVLIDPFISENPKAGHIDVDSMEADYILVTHGHGDHVSDVKSIAARCDSMIYSNFEVAQWFGQQGLKSDGINHGGTVNLDWGSFKYVNAIHSSSMPDGANGGNPGGFVVWNDEGCLYFAGDTAVTMDMQLIPRTCPPLDVAVLPVGDHFTMGYNDAVLAADLVACDKVVGCHFDTFPPIEIDHDIAKAAFSQKGKELLLLSIGEEVSV